MSKKAGFHFSGEEANLSNNVSSGYDVGYDFEKSVKKANLQNNRAIAPKSSSNGLLKLFIIPLIVTILGTVIATMIVQ